MRISAWSSDVCSSDLTIALPDDASHREAGHVERPFRAPGDARAVFPTIISGEAVEREQVGILQVDRARILVRDRQVAGAGRQMGRASCRGSVCRYVSISVVAVSFKKKNAQTFH